MFGASRFFIRSYKNSITVRQFSSIFNKISFSVPHVNVVVKRRIYVSIPFKREKRFLQIDNIPNDYNLIYRLSKSYLWISGYCTLYFFIPWLVYIMYRSVSPLEIKIDYSIRTLDEAIENVTTSSFNLSENELKYASGFACIGIFAMFLVSKGLVLRLYFNGERYIAVYMNSYYPLARINHEFTEVKVKTKTIFGGELFKVGRKLAFLFEDYFKTPNDYFRFSNNYYSQIANKNLFDCEVKE